MSYTHLSYLGLITRKVLCKYYNLNTSLLIRLILVNHQKNNYFQMIIEINFVTVLSENFIYIS